MACVCVYLYTIRIFKYRSAELSSSILRAKAEDEPSIYYMSQFGSSQECKIEV